MLMTSRNLPRWMIGLLACFTLLSGIAAADSPARPNILFLLSDDQRPDSIAALGNPHIQTPHLDALARRGVAFSRAVCANPICTPSRGEILTGCSGFRNGVVDFGRQLDPDLTLWPEALADAGYHTWYVGKWHNDGRPITRGYEMTQGLFRGGGGKFWKDQVDWKGDPVTGYRGWIFQDDEGNLFPDRGVGVTPDISARFADAAIELINRQEQEPFFLQVCFTAPHDPLYFPTGYRDMYSAEKLPLPPNFLPEHPFDHGNFEGRDEKLLPWPRTKQIVRELTAVYYAVISHMDAQVGRIIDALRESGQLDNTIIIFSSDHGLAVGSHGLRGKQSMYEHTINVPLLVAGPGIEVNRRSDAQVYLRDLYPTSCELAGVAIPASVEAKSFAGVLAGNTEAIHPHVFCYFRDKQRMLRTDRWKIIHYPAIDRWQLFDMEHDPHELHDLSGNAEHREVFDQMRNKLRQEQRLAGDPLAQP